MCVIQGYHCGLAVLAGAVKWSLCAEVLANLCELGSKRLVQIETSRESASVAVYSSYLWRHYKIESE